MRAQSPGGFPLWTMFERSSGLCEVDMRFIYLFLATAASKSAAALDRQSEKLQKRDAFL